MQTGSAYLTFTLSIKLVGSGVITFPVASLPFSILNAQRRVAILRKRVLLLTEFPTQVLRPYPKARCPCRNV